MEKEKSKHEKLVKEKEKQIKEIKSTSTDAQFRVKEGQDKSRVLGIKIGQLAAEISKLNLESRRKGEEMKKLQSDVRLWEYKFQTVK